MVDVMNEEEVSYIQARQIMEGRKKEGDLNYEQKVCLEFLEKLPHFTEKQFEDFLAELKKITILKPRHMAMIMNVLPDTEEEVEALFSKERTNLKKEEVKQVVDTVKTFKK
jgi:DNA-directed RNA polymerase subunit F